MYRMAWIGLSATKQAEATQEIDNVIPHTLVKGSVYLRIHALKYSEKVS